MALRHVSQLSIADALEAAEYIGAHGPQGLGRTSRRQGPENESFSSPPRSAAGGHNNNNNNSALLSAKSSSTVGAAPSLGPFVARLPTGWASGVESRWPAMSGTVSTVTSAPAGAALYSARRRKMTAFDSLVDAGAAVESFS